MSFVQPTLPHQNSRINWVVVDWDGVKLWQKHPGNSHFMKSLQHTSQVAHQAGWHLPVISVPYSPPPDEMLVNGKVTLTIKLESTHFYTWMERGTHLYNEDSGTGVLGYTDGSQDSPSDNQRPRPQNPHCTCVLFCPRIIFY